MKKIRRMTAMAGVVLITIFFHFPALAQTDLKAKVNSLKPKDFPTQPIEFVVVYSPGGGMDVTARILAKHVEKYINSQVIVINKGGGAGLIGHTYLASMAKNDGYTVGILNDALWLDSLLRAKGQWNYKDLEPLIFIHDDPRTLVVSTTGKLKDKSIKEVIELGIKQPKTIKAGVVMATSGEYLLDRFEMAFGAKFLKVPFQGGAPSLIALLGGHTDFSPQYIGEFKPHLEAGKVKIIALCVEERDEKFFPHIPTVNEVMGRNDLISHSWRFAAFPKGVPRDRFRYLEAAINAVLHDPEFIKDFAITGAPIGGKFMNAQQTAAEIEKYFKMDRTFLLQTGRLSQ